MYVASVGRAFPPNYVDQDALIEAFRAAWGGAFHNPARVEQLHKAVLVGGRHLALPMQEYAKLTGFGQANDAWIRVGLDVGEAAVHSALDRAGLRPHDIDALYFTSVTGVAAPSLDARLVNRMGLRSDVKRVPIFGLGCVAGAAGIARCADYVRAFPDHVAVILSVELCSLTLQRDDFSIPNLIATGLFGDGAACAVVVGAGRPPPVAKRLPEIIATRSVFYPDTEGVMGWSIGDSGFRIVLSAEVPEMVRKHLRADVERFLADNGVSLGEIHTWIAHPGGPKVLEAMADTFALPADALARTWASLRELGNLSSSSVLCVLGDTMADPPPAGTLGLLAAMGPGFCSELVLVRWT